MRGAPRCGCAGVTRCGDGTATRPLSRGQAWGVSSQARSPASIIHENTSPYLLVIWSVSKAVWLKPSSIYHVMALSCEA